MGNSHIFPVCVCACFMILLCINVHADIPNGDILNLNGIHIRECGFCYFTENQGQWSTEIELMATVSFGHIALTGSGIFYDITDPNGGGNILHYEFENGNRPDPKGIDPLDHTTSFFYGNDPDSWVEGAYNFMSARYEDIWDGIDLEFNLKDETAKYQFILDSGASKNDIMIRLRGHERYSISGDDLIIELEGGTVVADSGLKAFYRDDPNEGVEVGFDMISEDLIGFQVYDWDRSRSLVIDPLLEYSTYIGGSETEWDGRMELDDSGNVYITGTTFSSDFPITPGAYLTQYQNGDAFVMKMDPKYSRLIYSTYIGGSSAEYGLDIALDDDGSVFLMGNTLSEDFPTTEGAYDRNLSDYMDIYVLKLNSTGSGLIYSTYFGSTGRDSGVDIELDGDGNAVVTARAVSEDYPVTEDAYDSTFNGGWDDIGIFKLNSTGESLIYSTMIGGRGFDYPVESILIGDDLLYVSGCSNSSDLPTTSGSYDPTYNVPTNKIRGNTFVICFNLSSSGLEFSTFVGIGYANGIAMDNNLNIYVTGYTTSSGFPVTPSAFNRTLRGKTDGFVYKLKGDGSGLFYSTLLGGSKEESCTAIAVNSTGTAFVTGGTSSQDFPTTKGALRTNSLVGDMFVTTITPPGNEIGYSTYLGGTSQDKPCDISVVSENRSLLYGETSSSDFPVTNGSYQTFLGGRSDLFISKLDCQRVLLPPTAPLNLSGSIVGKDIILNWEAPIKIGGASVLGYNISRGTKPGREKYLNTTDNLTFIDESVDLSRIYYYCVQAFNRIGTSPRSNTICIKETEPPRLIEDLTDRRPQPGSSLLFSANLSDDSQLSQVRVIYSTDGFAYRNISMDRLSERIWIKSIDLPDDHVNIHYSFFAEDDKSNRMVTGEELIEVGGDYLPTFKSDLTPNEIQAGSVANFSVRVFDNIGLEEVFVEYWVGNLAKVNRSMYHSEGDLYTSAAGVTGKPGDSIKYVFRALDVNGNWNSTEIKYISIYDGEDPILVNDLSQTIGYTGDPFVFRADIVEDYGLKDVVLHYRFGGGERRESYMELCDHGLWEHEIILNDTLEPLMYGFGILDSSGNVLETTEKTVVMIDNDPPVIVEDLSDDMAYCGRGFNISCSASDNIALESVRAEYWFSNKPHNMVELDPYKSHFGSEIPVPGDALGSLFYKFRINDTSSNPSYGTIEQVNLVDVIPPTIEPMSDIETYPGSQFSFSVDAVDNIGIAHYIWSGLPFHLEGPDWSDSIQESGSYDVTITVFDAEGNSDTDSFLIVVWGKDHDSDSDGIPDLFEMEHGLSVNDPSDAQLDQDQDGATNLMEFEYGTDPNRKDTDQDGMPDGWEMHYGLDPISRSLDSDSDGDGYSDLEEYLRGMNPVVKDHQEDSDSQKDTNPVTVILIIILFVVMGVAVAVFIHSKRRID